MKRKLLILLLCVLTALAIGCGEKEPASDPDIPTVPEGDQEGSQEETVHTEPPLSVPESIPFEQQYAVCYTHHTVENGVYTVGSVDELNAFCESVKDMYNFWEIPQPNEEFPWYYHIGFLNAVTKYDSAYFEDHALVMVYVSGSGRCRFGVEDVSVENGKMEIGIEKRVAGNGYTDDIMEWIVFVELPKRTNLPSEENITVEFSLNTTYSKDELDQIDKERLQAYYDRTGIADTVK